MSALDAGTQRTLKDVEKSFDRLIAHACAERVMPIVLKRLETEGLLSERVTVTEARVRQLAKRAISRVLLKRAGRL